MHDQSSLDVDQTSLDFEQIEQQVNKSASLQTKNYCGDDDEMHKKVFLVYKFLLTPDSMLLHRFSKLDHHSLRKF